MAPGETQYASVTATIPAQTPLGSYPLTIQVQSGEDPSLTARVGLSLEVVKAGSFALELAPELVQGELSGEYTVRASQTGQESVTLNLSARDEGGLLGYNFSPAALQVPPAGSAASRLTVRPRQALTSSESFTINFELTAAPSGGSTASVTARAVFVHSAPHLLN